MTLSKQEHGGDIQKAAKRWGIPVAQWLDLSTAISPFCYPLATPPAEIWQQLPYLNDTFIEAAVNYYQCENLLPIAGSQQAIELLPNIFHGKRVALPAVGYCEHAYHWRNSENAVVTYQCADELRKKIDEKFIDIAIVINPNNPSTELYSRDYLLEIASALSKQNSYLIIDEAFIDSQAEHSLASNLPDNTIILRSIGKFFGLAGIRIGFVLAKPYLLKKLEEKTGLWQISSPALWAATQALNDKQWQEQQIQRLAKSSQMLEQNLCEYFPQKIIKRQSTFMSLFLSWNETQAIFEYFARKGILLRKFQLAEEDGLLRIGLPADSESLSRLMTAFYDYQCDTK